MTPEPYQIGPSKIYEWLATDPPAGLRRAFLDFLVVLSRDPIGVSERVPSRAPVYVALVPGTMLAVRFTLADQFHALHILQIEEVNLEEI